MEIWCLYFLKVNFWESGPSQKIFGTAALKSPELRLYNVLEGELGLRRAEDHIGIQKCKRKFVFDFCRISIDFFLSLRKNGTFKCCSKIEIFVSL